MKRQSDIFPHVGFGVVGGVQVVVGILLIILGVVDVVLYHKEDKSTLLTPHSWDVLYTLTTAVVPTWCGVWFTVTGSIGGFIGNGRRKISALYFTKMVFSVMSILSTVIFAPVTGAVSAIILIMRYENNFQKNDDYLYLLLPVTITFLSLVEMCFAILAAVLCCCCSNTILAKVHTLIGEDEVDSVSGKVGLDRREEHELKHQYIADEPRNHELKHQQIADEPRNHELKHQYIADEPRNHELKHQHIADEPRNQHEKQAELTKPSDNCVTHGNPQQPDINYQYPRHAACNCHENSINHNFQQPATMPYVHQQSGFTCGCHLQRPQHAAFGYQSPYLTQDSTHTMIKILNQLTLRNAKRTNIRDDVTKPISNIKNVSSDKEVISERRHVKPNQTNRHQLLDQDTTESLTSSESSDDSYYILKRLVLPK